VPCAIHDAWHALLSHPAMSSQKMICKLLCVCNQLRSIIAARCQFLLTVHFQSDSPEQAVQFALWLERNGSLCSKHLEIKLQSQAATHDADTDCWSDVDSSWDEAAAAVLHSLPTHITSLDLFSDRYDELAEQPSVANCTSNLQQLRNLKLLRSAPSLCVPHVQSLVYGTPSLYLIQ